MTELFTSLETGATFSLCRTWRYALWRIWSGEPCAVFIGLNPSTADETQDDPTIRRCIGFAKAWGYGGLIMLNIFAFRATDPNDMRASADPVGPHNDKWIEYYADRCGLLVAAWGVHGTFRGRGEAVVKALAPTHRLCHLGLTKDGHPRHPLYLRSDLQPILWKGG